MSLLQWCSENRIAQEQAVSFLQKQGMNVQAGQSLKEIAANHGTTPAELVALLSSVPVQDGASGKQ